MPKTYLVKRRCSTRRSSSPKSPKYDEWVNLSPGRRVSAKDLPDHASLAEWVASGHLSPVKEKKA